VKCLPNEMQRLFHRGEAYFSGVVKIIAFLELKQKLTFFKGLNRVKSTTIEML
jgi:hypothetical protein